EDATAHDVSLMTAKAVTLPEMNSGRQCNKLIQMKSFLSDSICFGKEARTLQNVAKIQLIRPDSK
ncbi:unnamed protein product, partial [Caretta caretta]